MRTSFVLAVATWLIALTQPALAREELIDGIAAQVGSDIVLVSEVTGLTAPLEEQMRQAGAQDEDVAMVRSDMLERLIERRLVEQVVRRMELEASDAEVDQGIAAIASENGLSMEELRASLESHGLSWDGYREKIRGEIQRSKIVNGMVRSKVKVEEEDLRDLYAKRYSDQHKGGSEMHLRHLVVTSGEEVNRTPEDACNSVRAAQARVGAGETFADVARQVSVSNPELGGDVGWVHENDIAPWMADAVRGLEPGQMSDVVEMPFGCNLFFLEERRGFEPLTFDEAKEGLFREIYNQKLEIEYEQWMDQLRSRTYIERKGVFSEAARLGEAPSDPTQGGVGLTPMP